MRLSNLTALVECATEILSAAQPVRGGWVAAAGERQPELEHVFRQKNGFLAFDRALRFFAADPTTRDLDLDRWNSPGLWRDTYGKLADDLLFFADDIFGGQFCIKDSRVYSFEPETGTLELFADDLDGWAARILSETDYYTGRPLALDWQEQFGQLTPTQRLLPTLLFTLGGEFVAANLSARDAATAMRIRGPIAQKIYGLPEGTQVRFVIEE